MREFNQSLVQISKNFWLPRFNPETADSDPAAWCAAVNLIIEENPLQSSALEGNYNFNNERRVDFYVVKRQSVDQVIWINRFHFTPILEPSVH